MKSFFAVLTFSLSSVAFAGGTEIKVFKSPTCGCCGNWEEHLRKSGFNVTSKPTDDMSVVKHDYKIPSDKASCHTAVIQGYVIEGHVPATVIKKLLKEHPKDVYALTVPGMPMGSPGMEAPGKHPDYQVIALKKDGTSFVYSKEKP